MILTPTKVIAFVTIEISTRPRFLIETASSQGMTKSGRCYIPEDLAHGGQKKDELKRPISDAEAKEFWGKM